MKTKQMDPFDNRKFLLYDEKVCRILKGQDIYPVTVEIDPVSRRLCNHNCYFCSFNHLIGTGATTLPKEVMLRLPGELALTGVKGVVWTGEGEPTVHNALWEALPLFKAEGIQSGLFTNGSLLNEERCEIIVDTCAFVRFSLDAPDQETHTRIHRPNNPDFEKIVRNIWLLTSLREETGSSIKIGVSYLVCPENYQGIVEGTKLMKRIGVDYFQLKPVVMFSGPQIPPEFFRETARPYIEKAVDLADENFKVYALSYKFNDMANGGDYGKTYHKCWGHPFRAVIGSDSNAFLCCHLKGLTNFSFGNLKEKSWQEIWNGAQRREAISRIDLRKCQPLCTAHEMNKILEDLSQFEDPCQRIAEILGSERDAARDAFL